MLIVIVIVITIVYTNTLRTYDGFKVGSLFTYAEIDYKVAKMSLREKIGQMMIVDFRNFDEFETNTNKTPMLELSEDYGKALADLSIGGIILFSECLDTTSQIVKLIDDAQNYRIGYNSLNNIPLLVCVDQEGGSVTRLKTGTNFPGNMALAATDNKTYAYLEGEVISEELNALGINTNFAPVVDINSNPDNPIIGLRSYSDNPGTVYEFASEFIKGSNKHNTISTIKHFPGHGDTYTDSHTGLPTVLKTYDELKEFELLPFIKLIDEGVKMILTAHIEYPNIESEKYYSSLKNEEISLPATLSKTMLTDILRNDLGFKGVIVSDSLVMDAIDCYFEKEEVAKLAINAGIDMLLMPIQIDSKEDLKELEEYISSIEMMVTNGEIKEKTINQHVKRILNLKANHNLLEYEPIDLETKTNIARNSLNSKEHHDIEYQICLDAITEYTNDGLIPLSLKDKEKLTIMYPYDSNYLPLSKGIEKVKEEGLLSDFVKVEFLKYDSSSSLKEFQNKLKNTDCLIIISSAYYPYELDLNNKAGSNKLRFIMDIINSFKGSKRNVIAISSNLPYDTDYLVHANAVVLTYNSNGYFVDYEELNGDTPSPSFMFTAVIEKIFKGDLKGILPVEIE